MPKLPSDSAEPIREKKDKKDKKRKHSESASTAAPPLPDEVEIVAERKRKDKTKKRKSSTTEVLNALEAERPGAVAVDADGDVIVDAAAGAEMEVVKDESEEEKKAVVRLEVPLAALVPFANPLCDEKALKKVLKGVKKAAKNRAIKRGVKEVVKSVRKSPLANPTNTSFTSASGPAPPGIVILAADISPMDVISHIPVLCEDHAIPYLYVPSRAELGAAGATKRPTSVVMVTPKAGGKVKGEDGAAGQEEWEEGFAELWKVAVRLGQFVRV